MVYSPLFSKKLSAEAKSYGVEIDELVMADLVAIGYNKFDAFLVAYPECQSKSPLQARNIMESVASGERFKNLVKERSRTHKDTRLDVEIEEGGLMDKKQAAKEILRVAQSLPDGSKEKGEMFVKYMEMLRKNDESVDAGNDHISYYLPLSCSKCSLYKEFNDRQRENEIAERKALEGDE